MGVAPGGAFTAAEAAAKTETLDCHNLAIGDLTGIEYFTGVRGLNCSDNQLTGLDLSYNTALIMLNCINNQLSSLDVTSNAVLTTLWCSGNQMTSLNLPANPALTQLNCSDNQLTSLDIASAAALTGFSCAWNQLTDISSLTANLGLGAGDSVNVMWNNLTCDDWADVLALQSRIGAGFHYSPQRGWNPFDCNINTAANFPDPNFRAAVETFMGVAPGGAFTAAEAAAKTETLDCHNLAIGDLTGIEYFTGVRGLNCSDNQLTGLDLSTNAVLRCVYCSENQLTSLDLPANPALTQLNCRANQLTSLDIASATALTHFCCVDNQLITLDVSNNLALVQLNCANNQLTSLALSTNTALTHLICTNNQLSSLDLSTNTALLVFYCNWNQLTEISSLTANSGLGLGDTVNICWNHLTCDDWADILVLQSRSFAGFYYSPQRELNPFDCSGGGGEGAGLNGPGIRGLFDARFSVAEAMGYAALYPAWRANCKTPIQPKREYDIIGCYSSRIASDCALVEKPDRFPLVNYLLMIYRLGYFDTGVTIDDRLYSVENSDIQAVIWNLLTNEFTGEAGSTDGGEITWQPRLVEWLYDYVDINGSQPDYSVYPYLPIVLIIDCGEQVNLLEIPYTLFEELSVMGIVEDCL